MDVRNLEVRGGDRVVVRGVILHADGRAWCEPQLPTRGPSRTRRDGSTAEPSRFGIALTGDVASSDADGHGRASPMQIEGVWADDTISVNRITAHIADAPAAHDRQTLSQWVQPPCPPPTDGWPQGETDGNLPLCDLRQLVEDGVVVASTVFRPTLDQQVLVVAVTDPELAGAVLRPQLGDQLCIVEANWTKRQLDDAFAHLKANWGSWRLFQAGPEHDAEGQPHILASLAWVTDEIADWVNSQPTGLVDIDPWITPIR